MPRCNAASPLHESTSRPIRRAKSARQAIVRQRGIREAARRVATGRRRVNTPEKRPNRRTSTGVRVPSCRREFVAADKSTSSANRRGRSGSRRSTPAFLLGRQPFAPRPSTAPTLTRSNSSVPASPSWHSSRTWPSPSAGSGSSSGRRLEIRTNSGRLLSDGRPPSNRSRRPELPDSRRCTAPEPRCDGIAHSSRHDKPARSWFGRTAQSVGEASVAGAWNAWWVGMVGSRRVKGS